MKTERDYGYGYAAAMQGEEGFDAPVNINEMVNSSVDIPPDDYRAMIDTGINNPDAREYWKGFNSFFTNLSSAAAALGRKGGAAKSPAKAAACKENGKKGGRPKKVVKS